MSDMSTTKTASKAKWKALPTQTRAHGASLGITSEADVERISGESRRDQPQSWDELLEYGRAKGRELRDYQRSCYVERMSDEFRASKRTSRPPK